MVERELIFEFHVAGKLRKQFGLDVRLFATNGKVVFANFHAVRLFVHKLNQTRPEEKKLFAGEVNAAGLLEELFHIIIRKYEQEHNPNLMGKALSQLQAVSGMSETMTQIKEFVSTFPPMDVYQGRMDVNAYLAQQDSVRPPTHVVLEEMLLLWLANKNPANKKLKDLFDTGHLPQAEGFETLMKRFELFCKSQPLFATKGKDLISLLMEPILAAPDDLFAQLEFIRREWEELLPAEVLTQLLRSADLFREDVMLQGGPGGPAPTMAPVYKGTADDAAFMKLGKSGYAYAQDTVKEYEENENFTADIHWMPNVVLLAKNTYVWLDQLSKKHQRHIKTLDQIPDEELDILAGWNVNGLWLIGLWERSEASRRIKHIMGNTDAVSSAYSLYDYQIAADLGGEWAYQNLNERARARGIRLASDMVPNHTGIFSQWVIEHPEYFIQASEPPFPGYTFTGENLSQHPDLEIRIEDGYFSKTDAAVVFQRIDRRNGEIRYIYHGNDGTVMPWNDTAQLDMIKHEVRQAVINKIFEVARKSSIIRFDAAMTLAKKHFSRLWYPRPGTGGDIPSRADYALPQEEFDRLFPVEFWREVVDRINAEMPETLLLAEAFWFMEGYFVRTLGMHRVYNSAFMHMLKNEENEKYRDLITNTLEFEPEILKRYVNFMSNPDEETAIRQFGTGDKYFGVCVLMTTLPGLPMFGHGQVEGYTEKYGMEYQRAYYNETPNQWLVEKHEREIFPLTAKRYLFSEVEQFNIFDFMEAHGGINENVFAYSNRHGNEKALVFFNNKYDACQGYIQWAAPKLIKGGQEGQTTRCNLAQALGMNISRGVYYIVKEHISGLEYLYHSESLAGQGFHIHLNGFEYRVFLDFREVWDVNGEIWELSLQLKGQGTPSIDRLLGEMRLKPVHEAFIRIFSDNNMKLILGENGQDPFEASELKLKNAAESFSNLLREMAHFYPEKLPVEKAVQSFVNQLKAVHEARLFFAENEKALSTRLKHLGINSPEAIWTLGNKKTYRENAQILLATIILNALQSIFKEDEHDLYTEMLLSVPLQKILQKTGRESYGVDKDMLLIHILRNTQGQLFEAGPLAAHEPDSEEWTTARRQLINKQLKAALDMLTNEHIQNFIGVNTWQGVTYFSRENYEEITEWFFTLSMVQDFGLPKVQTPIRLHLLEQSCQAWLFSHNSMQNSEYRFEKLTRLVNAGIKEKA